MMNGPAGVDIKWKDIAARPFKVVVLVELAAQARKEVCTRPDAAKSARCDLAALWACHCALHGHDTRFPAVSSHLNLGIDVFT